MAAAILLFLLVPQTSAKLFNKDGISFMYSSVYVDQTVDPKNSNQLLRATRKNPDGIIIVTKAESAKKAADALRINQLDYLELTANSRFKVTYKNFEKIETARLKISGYDLLTMSFSYIGNDNTTKIYMKYIMIVRPNNVYYVTVQSTSTQRLEADVDQILTSLK